MKVVHLSTSDGEGGAYRAAYRLHVGLRYLGIHSEMFVASKVNDAIEIHGPTSRWAKVKRQLFPLIDELLLSQYKNRQRTPFSLECMSMGVSAYPVVQASDIINLHWINRGFVRPEDLSRFHRPIVWTLHDMWAFTGGCHYAGDCIRYKQRCGACPQLGSSHEWDLSRYLWRRKEHIYSRLPLTIVAPSRWLADCARESALFYHCNVQVIPYGLDTSVFRPIDKTSARAILGIPDDGVVVTFGALRATTDPRKGFSHLQQALHCLASQDAFSGRLRLVVFGASHLRYGQQLPFETICLGMLHDDISLVLGYSAADVLVVPSLEDNLPNTVLESLACGTPVVAFRIGGMPDAVDHKVNGYLAEERNSADLTAGVRWILEDHERRQRLSLAARSKAESTFTLERQAAQYASLYESLMDFRSSRTRG